MTRQHLSYSPEPPDVRYGLLPAATRGQHASFVDGGGGAAAAVEVGAAAVDVARGGLSA